MHVDADSGVVEVGVVCYSPRLKRTRSACQHWLEPGNFDAQGGQVRSLASLGGLKHRDA